MKIWILFSKEVVFKVKSEGYASVSFFIIPASYRNKRKKIKESEVIKFSHSLIHFISPFRHFDVKRVIEITYWHELWKI